MYIAVGITKLCRSIGALFKQKRYDCDVYLWNNKFMMRNEKCIEICGRKIIVSMLLLNLLGQYMGYQASTNYSFH